jgi:hypothetical protein
MRRWVIAWLAPDVWKETIAFARVSSQFDLDNERTLTRRRERNSQLQYYEDLKIREVITSSQKALFRPYKMPLPTITVWVGVTDRII